MNVRKPLTDQTKSDAAAAAIARGGVESVCTSLHIPPLREIVIKPFGEGFDGQFCRADLLDCRDCRITLALDEPLRPGIRFFVKVRLSTLALVAYEVKRCDPLGRRYRVDAEFRDFSASTADCAASLDSVVRALLSA